MAHNRPGRVHDAIARVLGRMVRAAVVGLAAVLVLGGCTGVVYNRVDLLVSWYINGLVSLDDAQDDQLHAVVRRTMRWHRETQLPRYVALLERLAEHADRPATPGEIEDVYQQTLVFMDDFTRHLVPEVTPLLRTLRRDQIAELRESFEEGNEELWEDFGGDTPADRQARRTRNAVRMTQRLVGRIDGGQRAVLEGAMAGFHDVSEHWLDRRRHWQDRFLRMLSAPPPGEQFDRALLDLALNPNQFDAADYRQKVEANRRIINRMLADLSAALTPKQQQHLRGKFRDYARDLRRIGDAG